MSLWAHQWELLKEMHLGRWVPFKSWQYGSMESFRLRAQQGGMQTAQSIRSHLADND